MKYDDFCERHLYNDCWGCPFKEKAGRNKTCKEWIAENKADAAMIVAKYIENGMCIIDRHHLPFVGKLADGRYQQICPQCFDVHVIAERDVFFDDYIGKLAYVCANNR